MSFLCNKKLATLLALLLNTIMFLVFISHREHSTTTIDNAYLEQDPIVLDTTLDTLLTRLQYDHPYHSNIKLQKNLIQTSSKDKPSKKWQHWSIIANFSHHHITDHQIKDLLINLYPSVPEIINTYNSLPQPILKADFFRYAAIFAIGGVYTDYDTMPLKPFSYWETIWGQSNNDLILGIEADPDRPDWNDWYPRRIQLCQWTFAAVRGHPALANLLTKIIINNQVQEENEDEYVSSPNVMEMTGPGIFTDVMMDFMNINWQNLTNLQKPTVFNGVKILPITSFSPGIGHMNAGEFTDDLALVRHDFAGSWKSDD